MNEETRNRLWYLEVLAVMSDAKKARKGFKKGVKRVARACGVKKKEVIAGLRAHDRFLKQKIWIEEMQEKYPYHLGNSEDLSDTRS
jgi:hypothetical protein